MTRNRSWSRGQFAPPLNNAGVEFAEICVSIGIVDDHHSAQDKKSFNSIIRAQLTVRGHLFVGCRGSTSSIPVRGANHGITGACDAYCSPKGFATE